jgi:hypothetical protein
MFFAPAMGVKSKPYLDGRLRLLKKKAFFVTLTLILTENAGFSPAFIYEAEGFVLKRF